MAVRRSRLNDNSAAVAAQFGLTPKALRHYERLGLIKPPRTRAGWRVFGPAECERLGAIVALKRLGLPLGRIALLLSSGHADLDGFLAGQEAVLLRAQYEAEHARTLVRVARERLRDRKAPSLPELTELVQRIAGTVLRWSPELDHLARETLSPDQMSHIRRPAADAARLSAMWEEILDGLKAFAPDADPASGPAQALGHRMIALFRELSGGDKAVWNSNAVFWQQAARDPAARQQLQGESGRFDFVSRVLAELERRGELKF